MSCTCKPGRGLCISCLSPIEKRNVVKVGAPINGAGEFTINQVDIFEEQFRSSIVADVELNPLSAAVKQYGNSFYEVTNAINNDFLNRSYIVKKLPDYTVLSERLQRGPITPLEFAAFIKNSNYTPSAAIVSSNANGSRFLNELEGFYNGDFSTSILGGFCSLFANIFGAIGAFFDLIDSLNALTTDALNFIEKIKNIEDPIKAFFEKIKVKALIEAIKEKIVLMIEQTIMQVCMAISNFNVEAITGPINNSIDASIVANVEEKKTLLQDFCGTENSKRIVAKIKALIDYAVGLFENPSLEEIQFLIARICALATGIEGVVKKLKEPLNDFGDRYEEVFNTIKNASNRVTGEAVRAGALRTTKDINRPQINIAKAAWEEAGNVRLSSAEEYRGIPTWEALQAGSDPRLKIRGGWVTRMTPASEGWTKLDMNLKVLIIRLQEDAIKAGIIPGHLYLNSGFRSVQYNAKVGGAKSSKHTSGLAVDLAWDGFKGKSENTNLFVALARKTGFKGIGLYNTFVHLDIGPEKQWDKRS